MVLPRDETLTDSQAKPITIIWPLTIGGLEVHKLWRFYLLVELLIFIWRGVAGKWNDTGWCESGLGSLHGDCFAKFLAASCVLFLFVCAPSLYLSAYITTSFLIFSIKHQADKEDRFLTLPFFVAFSSLCYVHIFSIFFLFLWKQETPFCISLDSSSLLFLFFFFSYVICISSSTTTTA